MLLRADIILEVVDASAAPMDGSHGRDASDALPSSVPRKLLVLNKCDLGLDPAWRDCPSAVRISCKTGEGFDSLTGAIFDAAMHGAGRADDFMVAINARHQACLKSAAGYLDAARAAMEQAVSPEFIAIELRAALQAVGDVAGRLDAEELLGEIFSKFCIGK
jgi:tRNA modification GTPase